MSLSYLNIFKKEDAETESTKVEAVDPSESSTESSQGEADKKGKHGEDFCCGSCS